MRMLDGVHSNTSNSGPVLLLGLGFVVSGDGSQERLIASLSTGNDTNHGSEDPWTDLRTPEGSLILDLRPSSEGPMMIPEVPEARARVPLSPSLASMLAIIVPSGMELTGRMFPVLEGGFLTGIDEHASVHVLDGDEVFSSELVLVNVAELNLSERGSTSGIVDNILDDSLNVALSLSEIEGSEFGRCQ